MAQYPGAIVSVTNPAGTSPLATGPDHAVLHSTINDEVVAIETTLGTNSGTSVLKNAVAGKFAVMNTGGTLDAGVLGTPMVRGGTIGTAVIGTSTVEGGTANNQVIGSPTITGGAYNAGTFGTPVIGTIAPSGTAVPLSFGGGITGKTVTLSDSAGGTIAVNVQTANMFSIVLGTSAGNRTIGSPTNHSTSNNGQIITFAIKTSGSANGTIVWPTSAFRISQDIGTPAVGTGTLWHYFSWRRNSVDGLWDFQGQIKNLG